MMYQYNICVAEGIHYILGQYGEGLTFEKIKRYALTAGPGGGAEWRFTPVFDFDSVEGFWQMMVLPEIQQERQRQDIQSLVAARAKFTSYPPGGRKKKWEEERTGSNDWWSNPKGTDTVKPAYPTGLPSNAMGKKMGFAHRPLGREGEVMCYGFSAHAGCHRKESCTFSHQSRIRADGLHWAAEYEIARRGGLASAKRIDPQAVGGYLQALMERNADIKKMIANCKTGTGGSRDLRNWRKGVRAELHNPMGGGGKGVSGTRKGEESARAKDVVIEEYPAENSTDMRGSCEEREMECQEDGREEQVEIGVAGRPVIFDIADHRALAENMNPHV